MKVYEVGLSLNSTETHYILVEAPRIEAVMEILSREYPEWEIVSILLENAQVVIRYDGAK